MGDEKEKRIALVGIIVTDTGSVGHMNETLHKFKDKIIGRMGIPHEDKHVISIVMNASQEEISALSGKLGMIKGITTKTVYEPK